MDAPLSRQGDFARPVQVPAPLPTPWQSPPTTPRLPEAAVVGPPRSPTNVRCAGEIRGQQRQPPAPPPHRWRPPGCPEEMRHGSELRGRAPATPRPALPRRAELRMTASAPTRGCCSRPSEGAAGRSHPTPRATASPDDVPDFPGPGSQSPACAGGPSLHSGQDPSPSRTEESCVTWPRGPDPSLLTALGPRQPPGG